MNPTITRLRARPAPKELIRAERQAQAQTTAQIDETQAKNYKRVCLCQR